MHRAPRYNGASLDVGYLLDRLEVLEYVGVGDRHIDALQIKEITNIVRRPGRHDRQHTKLATLVEIASDLGCKRKERAFG
jgi:hypothetical protein